MIEPGVGFFDLYEHLQANNIPLMLSVPGNAWGSVLGNALERGIGYTPMGNHTRQLCGMEVVMPDGDLVRTGMGAMEGNHAWHCFPFAFGPGLDQLFCQSNYGIVTKAGLWLMPEAETQLALSMQANEEDDIAWIVDTIAPLKRAGVISQNQFVSSWLGRLVLMGQRSDFYDGAGAIPEARVRELLRQHNLGFWYVNIRLYGDDRITRAQADVIKEAFARHTSNEFVEEPWRKGEPFLAVDPSFGAPSAVPLAMGAWTGGRGAHLGFSPVVPPTSEHVMRQFRRSRQRIAEYDLDFYASFTIGDRHANNMNMLMFDRDDPAQIDKVRRLFDALVADAKQAGYGEYRTHLDWMDPVAQTFDLTTMPSCGCSRRSRTRSIPTASSRRASRASGPPPIGSIGHEPRLALAAGLVRGGGARRLRDPQRTKRTRQRPRGRRRPPSRRFEKQQGPDVTNDRVRLAAEQNGERMFMRRCGVCHLEGGMGTMVLARRLPPEQAKLQDRRGLRPEFVVSAVRERHGRDAAA